MTKFQNTLILSLLLTSTAVAGSRSSQLVADFKNDLQTKCVSVAKTQTAEVVEDPEKACAEIVVPRLLADGVLEAVEQLATQGPKEAAILRAQIEEVNAQYEPETLTRPQFVIGAFAMNNLLDKLEGKK